MIWGLYQHSRISDAEHSANSASNKSDRFGDELADLRRSVNRLTLGCQAMWELLRENTDLTEQQLDERIQEIDLRDGSSDGRLSMRSVICPGCQARSNSRRANCVMCGASLAKDHVFEA